MQIVYFPYLAMGRNPEVSFGNLRVWNFDLKAYEYIPDESLRARVTALLRTNVSVKTPLKGIGVVSVGAADFRELNPDEFLLVNEAKRLLFLSFLSKSVTLFSDPNAGHYLMTSENFSTVVQNFTLTDDHIAVSSGLLVNRLAEGIRSEK